MDSYGKAKTGEAHGPGGLKAATSRNPNSHGELNDAPCGPCPHMMGYTGDGGVHGDASVEHRGAKFNFK